jgi:hypothetical protein
MLGLSKQNSHLTIRYELVMRPHSSSVEKWTNGTSQDVRNRKPICVHGTWMQYRPSSMHKLVKESFSVTWYGYSRFFPLGLYQGSSAPATPTPNPLWTTSRIIKAVAVVKMGHMGHRRHYVRTLGRTFMKLRKYWIALCFVFIPLVIGGIGLFKSAT